MSTEAGPKQRVREAFQEAKPALDVLCWDEQNKLATLSLILFGSKLKDILCQMEMKFFGALRTQPGILLGFSAQTIQTCLCQIRTCSFKDARCFCRDHGYVQS